METSAALAPRALFHLAEAAVSALELPGHGLHKQLFRLIVGSLSRQEAQVGG